MAPKEIVAISGERGQGEGVDTKTLKALGELRTLIATLRGEGGCPWDRKQTPESVTHYLLEEVYEFISAVEDGNLDAIGEELGDVLFQVLFIAHMYEEGGDFDLAAVADMNRTKMTRRHPHVFGDEALTSAGEVKQRWAEIKAAEKPPAAAGGDTAPDLPVKLPALLKACRYFDRLPRKPNAKEALTQAQTALQAVGAQIDQGASLEAAALARDAGDALLHLVHTVQRLDLHPESLLNQALKRQLSKT